MANQEQLTILKQGVEIWNKWRKENPAQKIDLSNAKLSEVNLRKADLLSANLMGADLRKADLRKADLMKANCREARLMKANFKEAHLLGADFSGAHLVMVDFSKANLSNANLIGANLRKAQLGGANLSNANLSNSNLSYAILINTKITNAIISNSNIFGVNVWGIEGEFKEQKELIITHPTESTVTVDNIKVAQFIYLLLNNKEIRDAINTLTSKSVLILGRFSIPERKVILDTLRKKLREYDLLPIVFDFDRPDDKDFTETIKTLAGLSYFVIADVTNPKSSPLELQATVPDYQTPLCQSFRKVKVHLR